MKITIDYKNNNSNTYLVILAAKRIADKDEATKISHKYLPEESLLEFEINGAGSVFKEVIKNIYDSVAKFGYDINPKKKKTRTFNR